MKGRGPVYSQASADLLVNARDSFEDRAKDAEAECERCAILLHSRPSHSVTTIALTHDHCTHSRPVTTTHTHDRPHSRPPTLTTTALTHDQRRPPTLTTIAPAVTTRLTTAFIFVCRLRTELEKYKTTSKLEKETRKSPCAVCKGYKLQLETVGIRPFQGGPFKGSLDLTAIEVYKERAEVLARDLANKGAELRELSEAMRKLKELYDSPQRHAERLASTMIAKKAVWERSTAHIVESYAECPVCEGASGCAFNPFQFELGHFTSCTREGEARVSISAAAANAGDLDNLVAICHECNKWHEQHSATNPAASLQDVKDSYAKLLRSQASRLHVPESPMRDEDSLGLVLSPAQAMRAPARALPPQALGEVLVVDSSLEDEIESSQSQQQKREKRASGVGQRASKKARGYKYSVVDGGVWKKQ